MLPCTLLDLHVYPLLIHHLDTIKFITCMYMYNWWVRFKHHVTMFATLYLRIHVHLYIVYKFNACAGIVDFLKSLGRFIFNLFRWRQRKRAATGNPAAAKPASTETEGAESDEGRTSRSSNDSQNAAASGSGVREIVYTSASHNNFCSLPPSLSLLLSFSVFPSLPPSLNPLFTLLSILRLIHPLLSTKPDKHMYACI